MIQEIRALADLALRCRDLSGRTSFAPDACHGSKQRGAARAGQDVSFYLRDAQAYMLISMPTDTSTIFGVFQVIRDPPN